MKNDKEAVITPDSYNLPLQDGYSSLINQSIDELNVEHSFAGSELKKRTVKKKRLLPILKNRLFQLLLSVSVLNLFVGAYLLFSREHNLPLPIANQEVAEYFSSNKDYLSTVSSLTSFTHLYTNPEDPDLTRALSHFKSSLDELGAKANHLFDPKEFRYAQGGIYWSQKSAPTQGGSK